ncbi:hypothetical protein [Staphylococcus caeli]|uniref:hypothetical protein n=1 Tax=Staphylococcus caeli TaxID=2201815 RepID=UPI003F566A89
MEINYDELLNFNYEYIFDFYDMPLFFILSDKNNKLYLNYMIDEVNNNEMKWFFAHISRIELNDLINRNIGVKKFLIKLIKMERMKYLYINNENKSLFFESINEIETDELPLHEFFVEYDYLSKKEIEYTQSFNVTSNEFDLILRDQENSHLVEVNTLTKTLECFQNLFKAVSKGITNLKVEAIYPSSFGMRLVGEDDLFETSKRTLANIFLMLNNIKDKNSTDIKDNLFIDDLYDLSALNKVSELAKNMEKYNISLELKAKDNPESVFNIQKSEISKFKNIDDLIDDLNPIEENLIEVRGMLNSINMNRNYFSIIDYDQIIYSGKLEKGLKNNLNDSQFIIPAEITAELVEKKKYNYDKEAYDIKYEMKSYRQKKMISNEDLT